MKKQLLLIACVLFSFTSATKAQTYGPNLVVNPAFEDGINLNAMTPWAFSSGNVALETTNVVSGRSIRFAGTASGSWANASQVVTVEAGATYKFGYTGFVLDAYGPQGGTLTSTRSVTGQVYSGNSAPSGSTPILVLPIASNVAISVSDEFTVPEGVTEVFIRLIKSYGICTVDDVLLQKKDVSTSIENISSTSVKVLKYSDNQLSISGCDVINVNIYDVRGKLIQSAYQKSFKLNTKLKGVYLAKITDISGKVYNCKFTL